MSLRHILLGLLEQPAAGYDLKRQFDASLRHFWPAELSQIYPTLQKLEREGFLESTTEPSPRGPDRRVYRRTEAGEAELASWLAEPPHPGGERFGYLAQIYFMDQLGDVARSRSFVEWLRERLEEWLAHLESVEQRWVPDPESRKALTDSDVHRYMTLRFGVHTLRAKLAWCDECLEQFDVRLAHGSRGAATSSPAGEGGTGSGTTTAPPRDGGSRGSAEKRTAMSPESGGPRAPRRTAPRRRRDV